MVLRVRAVSGEEREKLERMARSRTVGAGLVRRARIVLHALEGLKAPDIGARMDLCGATVRHWLKRFNARGLQGLEEDVRAGPAQRRACANAPFAPAPASRHRSVRAPEWSWPRSRVKPAPAPTPGARKSSFNLPDAPFRHFW